MATDGIGLYIHIPFCKRKCNYCDFPSFQGISQTEKKKYVDALISEINSYSCPEKIKVNTVFIGGGTPSLLGGEEMGRVLSSVYESFEISEDAEISMEANPGTLTLENAIAYRSSGINRISIGSQSFCENELKKLGRIHNSDAISEAVAIAREAGFSNINLDLMYGIPHQTPSSFAKSMEQAISLAPEHLSVYSLMLEEGTPFYQMQQSLSLPDEDAETEMTELLLSKMKAAGYERYEISNYAKPSFASRHNLRYWRNEEYLGFGVSAYSYFDGVRYGNHRDFSLYCQSPLDCVVEREELTQEDKAYEYVMTRFRLKEGVSLAEYQALFGVSFEERYRIEISRFAALGLLERENNRIFLNDKGMALSNTVLVDFMP